MWRLWLLCAVEGATVARHEAYEAFRRLHGRGSSDYERRLATFLRRSEEVQRQNARGTWRARLNKFADLSDSELEAMRSYHGHRPRRGRSLLQTEQKAMRRDAQGAKTWRGLRSALFVRSQGGCGSCWADAAAGALEMRAEIARGLVQRLSSAQLLRCTPNPEHCGGDGGCSGATAELAFGLAAQRGVALEGHDDCAAPPAVRPRGFVRLPENQLEPLLAAVSEGPVVVSVDAGAWTLYDSGIFDSCKRDATINHAVLMVGYGSSEGKKYWLIRNSWGADWGEQGYMRLLRHDGDFCGTDYDPKVGVGCRGGPASLPVCGMCGVLSDSSYPQF